MASIRKEIVVAADPALVWDAVRDYGAVHTRLASGHLTDTRVEDGARIVTFASGLVQRELIVDVDDDARRLVWAAVGGQATHHNGAMQVLAESSGTRIVWITDILPHTLKEPVSTIMDQALAAVKRTLDGAAS